MDECMLKVIFELEKLAEEVSKAKCTMQSIKNLCWDAQERELKRNIKYNDEADFSGAEVRVSDILSILDIINSPILEKIINDYEASKKGGKQDAKD